jgi:protein TonB
MTIQRQEYKVENQRRLRQCVLWSLGIHVLVLGAGFTLPRWSSEKAMALIPASLQARLVPSHTETQAVISPKPQSAASDHKSREIAPRVVALPPDTAGRPEVTSLPAPIFVTDSVTEPVAESAAKGAPRQDSVASSTAVIPSAGILDADALRNYRIALAAQARRFKRYPAQAMAAGWEGTVEVRLSLPPSGRPSVELVRSAGQAVLDRAAIAMIDAAAVRVAVPSSLQGKAFTITLPVMFSLEDQ